MAFSFDWKTLQSKETVQKIRSKLNEAANSNEKVDQVGQMYITELNFGVQVCVGRVGLVGKLVGKLVGLVCKLVGWCVWVGELMACLLTWLLVGW